jgi:adenosine 3'-phospho 5'-phosphosulfate transporter B3
MSRNNLELKIPIENTNVDKNVDINSEVKVLFYDIRHLSPLSQLLICSCGVFIFFLMYGYMQVIICTAVSNSSFFWTNARSRLNFAFNDNHVE